MIGELIRKRQLLEAINFAYEAGLEDKFPPVPLSKSFLKDSKRATASNWEDRNSSGPTTFNASRKEQSALRAVMEFIEDHKLVVEFPLEGLKKQLEHLEKAKVEKKTFVVSFSLSSLAPILMITFLLHGPTTWNSQLLSVTV